MFWWPELAETTRDWDGSHGHRQRSSKIEMINLSICTAAPCYCLFNRSYFNWLHFADSAFSFDPTSVNCSSHTNLMWTSLNMPKLRGQSAGTIYRSYTYQAFPCCDLPARTSDVRSASTCQEFVQEHQLSQGTQFAQALSGSPPTPHQVSKRLRCVLCTPTHHVSVQDDLHTYSANLAAK